MNAELYSFLKKSFKNVREAISDSKEKGLKTCDLTENELTSYLSNLFLTTQEEYSTRERALEEKNEKYKNIAVKAKKKMGDTLIWKENFNSLQGNYDKLLDRFEEQKKSLSLSSSDLEKSIHKSCELRDKLSQMEEYHRKSKEELKQVLEEKASLIVSLQLLRTEKDGIINELRERERSEIENKLSLRKDLESTKKELEEKLKEKFESEEKVKSEENKNLELEISKRIECQNELEQVKNTVSQLTIEKTSIEECNQRIITLKSELRQERNTVTQLHNEQRSLIERCSLESKEHEMTKNLLDKTREQYDATQNEFESYKIRAKNVLKASSTSTEVKEKSVEISQYEATLSALQKDVLILREKLSQSEKTNQFCQLDNEKLIESLEGLKRDFACKERTTSLKMNSLLSSKSLQEQEFRKTIANYEKTLQNLQDEHQNQMKEMTESFMQREEKSEDKLEIQKQVMELEHVQERPVMEREECEGCEKPISSPISLDRLLQSDSEQENKEMTKKINHLSALLSESESENAMLSQLTSVLKEEIRSYQRSEERFKHIEKLEYVKNIIIKFLVMKGSEEQLQLLPIISTLLELTPEETLKIQESILSQMKESESVSKGWSSYLWT